MALSRETLETIVQALNERSRQLGDIKRTGLTHAIREAASEDLKKTNKAWSEAETELLEMI